ncbi:TPA: hypothetical protein O7141_004095 [Salmonella enterica]|nr:hypothetical protein [Salmonella enterica]
MNESLHMPCCVFRLLSTHGGRGGILTGLFRILRSGFPVRSRCNCIISGFISKTLCIITRRCGCLHILCGLLCTSGSIISAIFRILLAQGGVIRIVF